MVNFNYKIEGKTCSIEKLSAHVDNYKRVVYASFVSYPFGGWS